MYKIINKIKESPVISGVIYAILTGIIINNAYDIGGSVVKTLFISFFIFERKYVSKFLLAYFLTCFIYAGIFLS